MGDQQGSYYVPEQSKLPLFMALAMFLTVFGFGSLMNGSDGGMSVSIIGFAMLAATMWVWFSTVIKENMAGLNNDQLKRSYVWGMGWFIFSEVMFFSAFFGALLYVRQVALPYLASEPNHLLWPGFTGEWPIMETPDQAANGEAAAVKGPGENMSYPGLKGLFGWLPFWNTTVLLISSFTVHIAHMGLNKNNKKQFNIWLGITVVLGIIFLFLQAEEYIHAYHVGLTIDSGIYGTTFFLLTGFHGLHVTMGTFMLAVMLFRSVFKGHFKHGDAFGFESASWYWHFVDVVWLGLFIFVYILG